MSLTQRQVLISKCEQIEYQNKRKPTAMQYKNKNTHQKWLPCFCELCKQHLDILTHAHAEIKHKMTKEQLITGGHIRFMGGN